jgi:hypothetical protein
MVAVRMVQMSFDAVVDMIAVRDRFMAAARAMHMPLGMAAAGVLRRAGVGVLAADIEMMFFDLASLRVMQVAIVQIVDVFVVLDRGVAAVRAVSMAVVAVCRLRHRIILRFEFAVG